MNTLRKNLVCLSLSAMVGSATQALAIPIDNFSGDQNAIAIGLNGVERTQLCNSSSLGDHRVVEAQVYGSGTQVSARAISGILGYEALSLTSGKATIIWDGDSISPGITFDGLGGINLLTDGASAFRLTGVSYDYAFSLPATITVTAYDAADPTGKTFSSGKVVLSRVYKNEAVTIPFSLFSSTGPLGRLGALSLVIDGGSGEAIDLTVDSFDTNGSCKSLCGNGMPDCCFTPTPKPTVAVACTATPAVTPTFTPAPTVCVSPSATPTVRPTATLTPAATPTVIKTATPSPTATATPSATATKTATATGTPTATSTAVATMTATETPTRTATASPEATLTPEPTATTPVVATETPAPTATSTPVTEASPTATPSAEPTVAPTATSTVSPTPTDIPFTQSQCTTVKPTQKMEQIGRVFLKSVAAIKKTMDDDLVRLAKEPSCRMVSGDDWRKLSERLMKEVTDEVKTNILRSITVCGKDCETVSFKREAARVQQKIAEYARAAKQFARKVVTCSAPQKQNKSSKPNRTDVRMNDIVKGASKVDVQCRVCKAQSVNE